MKGRTVLLDHIAGREAAALMVDGKLHDLLIDPPEDAAPGVGAIFFAVADRPLKGQGGITLQLGDGLIGYLRRAKDISPGDAFFVQVSGMAEPGKAIPVTPDLIFKSRYAIVTPHKPGINVSRAIRDDDERDRLLEIAHDVMAGDYGLILRSAATGADAQAVADDIATMQDLAAQVLGHDEKDPALLWASESAHHLAWRDWVNPDEVVTEDGCFETHGALEAIDAALSPSQPLSGGGHAYVEATRALIAVDVNTGKDHSLAAGLKANLAVARDLPRLLRLKGLGGQITLDLAPMPKRDRKQIEDAVKKSFRQDGSDVVVAGWTPLGHLELTRKRDRLPLSQVWPKQ
ncbi:ribonuclease E/G [Gymnodinialimonas hymeniacidonis]|uniref:ribonuclease E/G n=1 Tax=Gymnodinialimonas hymeniacidonis TaxID=3126508 RepID=UPI0034C5FF6C